MIVEEGVVLAACQAGECERTNHGWQTAVRNGCYTGCMETCAATRSTFAILSPVTVTFFLLHRFAPLTTLSLTLHRRAGMRSAAQGQGHQACSKAEGQQQQIAPYDYGSFPPASTHAACCCHSKNRRFDSRRRVWAGARKGRLTCRPS